MPHKLKIRYYWFNFRIDLIGPKRTKSNQKFRFSQDQSNIKLAGSQNGLMISNIINKTQIK